MQADFDREEVKLWQTIDETYSIDRNTPLGKGSYGKVYRGYSFQKQCLVAIKIVEKHKSDQNQIATLEALSSLNHQYVMGYYGHLQKQAQIYLFLQYCPNRTLKQFLMKGLSQLQVLRLFRQLVEGMCYINAKKKMHRDLKPENILIGPQFDIKISDFGLSQQTTSVIMTGQTGTPIYAAPEVYLNLSTNQKYTDNCDVWSAGLILYELLTGQHLLKKVIEQNSLKMLKQQWIEFHKGIRVVNLDAKYHPIWNVFINWLLDFDGKRRPTFLIVLQTIKRIYKQLSGQLQKDIVCFQQPLQRYHSFTEFHIQKYQILVDLCQTFTTRDINIRNEFKYLIMFCCLMRYISFTKTFIRNLTYKRLEFNKKPLIDQQQSKHPYLDLIIKKCQIVLDQRYDFYNQQVKITIIPKILNTYSQRPESQAILMALENVIHMVSAFSKGQSVAAEEKYEEALKSILPVLQRFHGDVTSYLKEDELKVYYQMLIAMNISDRYPTERFYEKDLFSIQKRNIQSYNISEVKRQINILKEHIF